MMSLFFLKDIQNEVRREGRLCRGSQASIRVISPEARPSDVLHLLACLLPVVLHNGSRLGLGTGCHYSPVPKHKPMASPFGNFTQRLQCISICSFSRRDSKELSPTH